MNDKQKQIEELTNKICSVLFIKSAQPNCSDCYFSDDCGYKVLSEELLKYYQPKIPEGAVVLTREEYERQQKDNEDFDKFARSIIDIRMKNGNKIATFKDLQDYIELQVKQGSKETAEKFAEKVKELFTKAKNAYKGASQTVIYHDKMMFHKGEERAMEKAIQFVDEIAKEFTGDKS